MKSMPEFYFDHVKLGGQIPRQISNQTYLKLLDKYLKAIPARVNLLAKTCLLISYWSQQEELRPPAVLSLASYLPSLVAFWKQWSWGKKPPQTEKNLLVIFQFFHWCDIIGYNIETSCQNKGEVAGEDGNCAAWLKTSTAVLERQ